ncbi:MAG: hypothetical protein APR55_03300 [Methanolinea sp. SDB]|nr:MAG: hypothetical protein APR55_03300 [Methanolinea sp. SDB]
MRCTIWYLLLGGAFCATILAGSIRSDDMQVIIGALILAVVVMVAALKSPNRGFYTLCFGEAPVFATLPSSFAAGFAGQLVLIAFFLYSTGVFSERVEYIIFFAYALVMAGAGYLLVSFKNPGLLFPVALILAGVLIMGILLNEHRLRVRVSGVADEAAPV